MQITCAGCKSVYNLTPEQLKGLSFSILHCETCNRLIKVSVCPHCEAYYSITFTSTRSSSYRLTCERCGNPFTIDFPLIKEAKRAVKNRSSEKTGRETFSFFKKTFSRNNEKINIGPRKTFLATSTHLQDRAVPRSSRASAITLSNLLALCGTAFTPFRIATAAIAIIIAAVMLIGYGRLTNHILTSGDIALNDHIKSFLNVVPFAITFFIYIMAAAVIARNTIDAMESRPRLTGRAALLFLARSLAPVFIANIIIFIAIDLIFILFGNIPVIGPVLFAILFFPIYAISLCIVILLAIGFWFYPPIIADSSAGSAAPIRGLFRFIREHKFSLVYAIPLMSIVSGVAFAALYMINYATFSLALYLARNVLLDGGEKIFSAIPAVLLRISEVAIPGPESGLFRSLTGNPPLSHMIGGYIIGIIVSLISVILLASFISISATLSTWVYVMMQKRRDMDDSGKIRVLLLLVLILAGIFFVKKIMF
ncbi:MAG: hypothetical protein JW807_10410 [Spirochaetes bacterium]|nr:hypothetical protein [Spirochaetota bacterium]